MLNFKFFVWCEKVITINLGQLQSGTIELGGSVKLHSLSGSIDGSIVKKGNEIIPQKYQHENASAASEVMDTETSEPTLSVMIHPSKRVLGSPSAQRALWRKREVQCCSRCSLLINMTYPG